MIRAKWIKELIKENELLHKHRLKLEWEVKQLRYQNNKYKRESKEEK